MKLMKGLWNSQWLMTLTVVDLMIISFFIFVQFVCLVRKKKEMFFCQKKQIIFGCIYSQWYCSCSYVGVCVCACWWSKYFKWLMFLGLLLKWYACFICYGNCLAASKSSSNLSDNRTIVNTNNHRRNKPANIFMAK